MRQLRFTFSALALIMTIVPAGAEVATAAQRAACTPDVIRLCSDEIPDVPAIIACLKRERMKLGNACRVVMDKASNVATRSVGAADDWCEFNGDGAGLDAVWRSWCKKS